MVVKSDIIRQGNSRQVDNRSPVEVRPMASAQPMAAAPMKYSNDGSVDWGNMWDSFCALAQEGGPPHRGNILYAQKEVDGQSEAYHSVVGEIIRGIREVSGLTAAAAAPGWVAIQCHSASMARWLSETINEENVEARVEGALLFVPAGEDFSLKGEIKNVITVVAKTTHYWQEHLPVEVKYTLTTQDRLEHLVKRFKRWLPFSS